MSDFLENNVFTYSSLTKLSEGKPLFEKISDSQENPFRVSIKKAMVLLQLNRFLDATTMALLLKTDFFDADDTLHVTQKSVTESRSILIRAEEAKYGIGILDNLPGKIKLLNLIIKEMLAPNNKDHSVFIENVYDFIITYYYDGYSDTIVKFDEHTEFLRKFIIKSKRYEVDGDTFYLKNFRMIEEAMHKFIKTSNCMFLSGKAGTGKTTTINRMVSIYGDKRLLIIAPTNAAVMRIKTMVCSDLIEIRTIHSAYSACISKKYDLIIVDESSMLSTSLVGMINELYTASEAKTIIFVGDYRQLPPVEKGNFFKTAITKYGNLINHNELTKVHRQESLDILKLANVFSTTEICNHRLSIDQICEIVKSDAITVNDYEGYGSKMRNVIQLSSKYNVTHHMIAYTNKTVNDINRIVYRMVTGREFVFKDSKKFLCKFLKLRATVTNTVKSKIVYSNNQYVEVVDWTSIMVSVKDIFTGEVFTITKRELNSDFTLGYVSTIHTSQGLGFDVVDFFMNNYNYNISKELYYTAITRAKKKLNLVKAERNNHHLCHITDDNRNTFY